MEPTSEHSADASRLPFACHSAGAPAAPEDYWDLHEASRMVAMEQPKVGAILQWVGSGLVLDLGCNDGGIAHRMQQAGARVVAADRLRYLGTAQRDYRLTVVALEAADPLPFSDGAFDEVVISGVLEYLTEPLELLKRTRRVLARRGRLILVAPNRNSIRRLYRRWRGRPPGAERPFGRGQLQTMLREAGFSIRAYRPCPYKSRENLQGWIAYALERILPGALATDFAFLCDVR